MHSKLVREWLSLVETFATTNHKFTHHGMRRIVEDYSWEVSGDVWRTGISLSYSGLGYKNDTSKHKQLARNYHNAEAIEAANKKLLARIEKGSSQTSVAVMMGAGKKSSKSMGFCMQSLVASHTKEGIRLVLFYRSTEVIQKFLADLKFLSEFIVPQLLKGIDDKLIVSVKFHFVNAYVSAMFFPLVYQFSQPVGFLTHIHMADRVFWRRAAVDLARMYRKDTVHSFRLHQNMLEFYRTIGTIDHAAVKKYLKHHSLVGKSVKMEKKNRIEEEDNDHTE